MNIDFRPTSIKIILIIGHNLSEAIKDKLDLTLNINNKKVDHLRKKIIGKFIIQRKEMKLMAWGIKIHTKLV